MVINTIFYEIIIFFHVFFGFLTICFALVSLFIIIIYWRTHCRSILNLLTCNSCIALIVFVITTLLQTCSYIQRIYNDIPPPSTFTCRLYACLATFGTAVEIYSYLVQALSRFFITILNKHKYLLTYSTNVFMIILSWIIGGLVASGFLFSSLSYEFEFESNYCVLTTKHFLTSFLAVVMIPMLTMIIISILYGIILYDAVYHVHMNPNAITTLRAKRNMIVFKRILIYISMFAIGGTPYLISIVWNRLDRAPWPLYLISLIFMSISALMNSIVLLVTNEQVKEILIAKLTRRPIMARNNARIMKINQIVPNPPAIGCFQQIPTLS